jgi:hypothetical protein
MHPPFRSALRPSSARTRGKCGRQRGRMEADPSAPSASANDPFANPTPGIEQVAGATSEVRCRCAGCTASRGLAVGDVMTIVHRIALYFVVAALGWLGLLLAVATVVHCRAWVRADVAAAGRA